MLTKALQVTTEKTFQKRFSCRCEAGIFVLLSGTGLLLKLRSRPLSRTRHRLSLRKLHILVADLIILAAAVVEGIKYVLFLIRR